MQIHLKPQPGALDESTTPRWCDVLEAIRTHVPGHHLIDHVAELPNATAVVLFFDHAPHDSAAAARAAVHEALTVADIHGWQVSACVIDRPGTPPPEAGPW